ncbi:Uncharacterised protein [Mycobacteroides abscessus subsp. massiliense]|nr:Uncharacterised protein [Mycobacteroides abscessus subsp. massiliense]
MFDAEPRINPFNAQHVPEPVVTLAAFDEPAKHPTDGGHRYTALLGDRFPQSALIDERLAHVEDDPPNSPQHVSRHITRVTGTRRRHRERPDRLRQDQVIKGEQLSR